MCWLRASWELIADGETIRRGELDLPDVGPGERAQLRLSDWTTPLPDGRVLSLMVRFRTAAELAWAPQGFEVCWAQLPIAPGIPELSRPSARPLAALPDGALVLDGDGLLVHEMLASSPRLFLWRAPTDNDRIAGLTAQWRDWGVAEIVRGAVIIQR